MFARTCEDSYVEFLCWFIKSLNWLTITTYRLYYRATVRVDKGRLCYRWKSCNIFYSLLHTQPLEVKFKEAFEIQKLRRAGLSRVTDIVSFHFTYRTGTFAKLPV